MTIVYKPNLNTLYWVDAHFYQEDAVNKAINYFKENPQEHMFNYVNGGYKFDLVRNFIELGKDGFNMIREDGTLGYLQKFDITSLMMRDAIYGVGTVPIVHNINTKEYDAYGNDKEDYNKWYASLTDCDKDKYTKMYPDMTFEDMFNRMMNRFGLILPPK